MAHIDTYSNFHLTITPKLEPVGCGPYFYLVTSNNTSHIAFRTYAAFLYWMASRGLTPEFPVSEPGESVINIRLIGTYRTARHSDLPVFYNLHGDTERTMDNGQYTLGIITTDADGIRTVHTLNPNVPRPVFDHPASKLNEDLGLASVLPFHQPDVQVPLIPAQVEAHLIQFLQEKGWFLEDSHSTPIKRVKAAAEFRKYLATIKR